MPAPSRIHTALRSVLEKYGKSTITPCSIKEDDISACISDGLHLIDEEDKENVEYENEQSMFPFSNLENTIDPHFEKKIVLNWPLSVSIEISDKIDVAKCEKKILKKNAKNRHNKTILDQ